MIIRLPAILGYDQVPSWWTKYSKAIINIGIEDSLEIEAVELINFDSSTLAVLLAMKKQLLAQGNTNFMINNPPLKLQGLARVYGIDKLLFI